MQAKPRRRLSSFRFDFHLWFRRSPFHDRSLKSEAIPGETASPNRLRPDQPSFIDALVSDRPPFSTRSLILAASCFVVALLFQLAFRALGGSLLFATYFPAVLVAALIAGLPAGIFVCVMSVVIVWWAFIPPTFSFAVIGIENAINIAIYVFSSTCILFVTESYRRALKRMREHERERELVTKELEHRSKNTYAVIDVIVRKSLEHDPSSADVISGRIRAVKFANDIINQSSTHTVLFRTLLVHEFVPYGEGRVEIEGPDIELSADTARHLALVFHELVTNAAKYGALSQSSGRVRVTWQVEGPMVNLQWSEEGGPPVTPPSKTGFGSKVVTQSLRALSGTLAPVFDSDGLRCSMTFVR
jgi:two-component sensor histidine kinase